LRDYVDESSFQAKARRTRKRVFDRTRSAEGEDKAPINAPKWTRVGYNGSLKTSIEKYTNRSLSDSSSEEESSSEKESEKNDKDEESSSEKESEKNDEENQDDGKGVDEGNLH